MAISSDHQTSQVPAEQVAHAQQVRPRESWHCYPAARTGPEASTIRAPSEAVLLESTFSKPKVHGLTASPVLFLPGAAGAARRHALNELVADKASPCGTSPWLPAAQKVTGSWAPPRSSAPQDLEPSASTSQSWKPPVVRAPPEDVRNRTPTLTFRTSSPGKLYRSISALTFAADPQAVQPPEADSRQVPGPLRSLPAAPVANMSSINEELLKGAGDDVKRLAESVAEAEKAAIELAQQVADQLRVPRRGEGVAAPRGRLAENGHPPQASATTQNLSWEEVALPGFSRRGRPHAEPEEDELWQSSPAIEGEDRPPQRDSEPAPDGESHCLTRAIEEQRQAAREARRQWQLERELLTQALSKPPEPLEPPEPPRAPSLPTFGNSISSTASDRSPPSNRVAEEDPTLEKLKQDVQVALQAMAKLDAQTRVPLDGGPLTSVKDNLEKFKALCGESRRSA